MLKGEMVKATREGFAAPRYFAEASQGISLFVSQPFPIVRMRFANPSRYNRSSVDVFAEKTHIDRQTLNTIPGGRTFEACRYNLSTGLILEH